MSESRQASTSRRPDPEWSRAAKYIYNSGGVAVSDRDAYFTLLAERRELESEVSRHHRDFQKVRELLDATDNMAGSTGMWNVLKEIRGVVG
jgi:hypothetical protein